MKKSSTGLPYLVMWLTCTTTPLASISDNFSHGRQYFAGMAAPCHGDGRVAAAWHLDQAFVAGDQVFAQFHDHPVAGMLEHFAYRRQAPSCMMVVVWSCGVTTHGRAAVVHGLGFFTSCQQHAADTFSRWTGIEVIAEQLVELGVFTKRRLCTTTAAVKVVAERRRDTIAAWCE